MKTQVQQTPGPWKVFAGNGLVRISDIHGMAPIAEMMHHNHPLNEANAAFIVRACNAYYDLLAACEKVLDSLGNMTTEDFRLGADKEARELLATVVAKARGD